MKDIRKSRRFFHIGELVFNCCTRERDNFDWGRILLINGKDEDGLVDEDSIVTLAMEHNDFKGENECYGDEIYKMCKSMTKLTGERVCFEHKDFRASGGARYPYYIPSCDENYFSVELKNICC